MCAQNETLNIRTIYAVKIVNCLYNQLIKYLVNYGKSKFTLLAVDIGSFMLRLKNRIGSFTYYEINEPMTIFIYSNNMYCQLTQKRSVI